MKPLSDIKNQTEALAGLLDNAGAAGDAAIVRELGAAFDDPTFRIVVFGEFNQGKSTLINALLGADVLPMSVVPTTALLTEVRYGDEPAAEVRVEGEERRLASLAELAEFATPADARRVRAGVEAITVRYPAALCRREVAIYDTPGLNDHAEQDEAATRALDLADLVLLVVDIRRLGTLNERTVLDRWLKARGLDAVIVAANFMNLVPPADYRDLRERLSAFAARWGCPYLPEAAFEVDALGGLRARLDADEPAWQRSGMGRLAAALERAVTENRALLRGRSRGGRLRTFVSELSPRLQEGQAAAERAATRARETGNSAPERALREVAATALAIRDRWSQERIAILANLSVTTGLPREEFPEPASLCAEPLAAFMDTVQAEWDEGLDRALGALPPGPPLSVRVQREWAIELPALEWEREPGPGAPGPGLPRDPEAALAAARHLAERGRQAAGKAAAGLHRGVDSLLDRAGSKADAASTPGRLLHQARGAWSTIKPPGGADPDDATPHRLTEATRAAIEQAAITHLKEVDAYLDRLAARVRQAVDRRAARAAPDPTLAAWQRAAAAAGKLLSQLQG